jgi:CubicO group peptidase (beta-lactamase class C family)
MAFAHEKRFTAGPAASIGLNWIITVAGADTIVWHNGGTGGYRTFAGIVPSRRVGVVVLTNSGGEGADDIGMHLLRPAIPLQAPPEPREQFTEIELPRATLARYVGTYALSPQFQIEVTLEGDTLWTQATGQPRIRIHPYTEQDFFAEGVDAQITFETDERGEVTRMVLHQNGRDVPGEKIR